MAKPALVFTITLGLRPGSCLKNWQLSGPSFLLYTTLVATCLCFADIMHKNGGWMTHMRGRHYEPAHIHRKLTDTSQGFTVASQHFTSTSQPVKIW